jgi:outer membrane receptor protein involved in Fe transport
LVVCLLAAANAQQGAAAEAQEIERVYDFDIHEETLGGALTAIARQTDLVVLYPQELARKTGMKPVVGRFTVREAIRTLFRDTQFSGGLTEHGVIYISISGDKQASNGEHDMSNRHVHRSLWASVIAFLSGGGVHAEDAPAAAVPLEEIVVTAQKRLEQLKNVPIAISVLSGAELDQATVNVADALNRVPGVATQQNYLGGGTVVVVRGVAPSFTLASGASPVAYYLDSIPFGLVKSALAPDSNAFDLERVEVLRGPQGTLYGASALNGVVRILTHDPELSGFDAKAKVSGSATQGGGNNYRADMAVNVPLIEDKLAARAVVGYENDSGWIDQPNESNVNAGQVQTYRLKINAQPTPDFSLGLSAWSSRNKADAPSVGFTSDRAASVLDQPISTDYDAYGLKLGYQFPALFASSATSYLEYTNKGVLGLDVPFFGNPPDTLFINDIKSDVFSEEVNLSSSLEGAWRWSAGGMYRRGTEDIAQAYTGAFGVFPPTLGLQTSKSYAVYGEVTRLFLAGQLELTAGLRHFHDDVSSRFQAAPGTPFTSATSTATADTPRGIVTWHPNDRQMLYVSYSQGFRSGFPQLGLPADFPVLQPDRLRNYEIGSKGTLMRGRVTYDTSVYYMDWQGIQAQLNVPYRNNISILAIINGQSASGIGADMALSVEPVSALTFTASVSWNDLSFDEDVRDFPQGGPAQGVVIFAQGDRPTSSPETTVGGSADYRFSLGSAGLKGRLSLAANYTSSQSYRGLFPGTTNLVVQKGDPIVLAHAGFSVESLNWTATLYGDNLNNERGAPVKAFIGVEDWDARVRPRTIGLQLQYQFK